MRNDTLWPSPWMSLHLNTAWIPNIFRCVSDLLLNSFLRTDDWQTSAVYRHHTRRKEVKRVLGGFSFWRSSMIHDSQGQVPATRARQLIHNFRQKECAPIHGRAESRCGSPTAKFRQLLRSLQTQIHLQWLHKQHTYTHIGLRTAANLLMKPNIYFHQILSEEICALVSWCVCVCVCVRAYDRETVCCMVAVVD